MEKLFKGYSKEDIESQIDYMYELTLRTSNVCYGPCPAPDKVTYQTLTVWREPKRINIYYFNFKDRSVRKEIIIHPTEEEYQEVLSVFKELLLNQDEISQVTDNGGWDLTINDYDEYPSLYGSCHGEFSLKLSDTLRDILDLPDLFAFCPSYRY